ncbi:MAG: ATP synthase delta/epsilon chain alpha-helix domain-containing protein [Cyanobacteria bacterium J06621_3]
MDQSEAQKAYDDAQSAASSVSADDRSATFKAAQALKKARARLQAAGGKI